MKENRFQTLIRRGEMPKGHMIMEFGTRGIAKILEAAGADYVVVDMEHTGFDADRIADLMAWFKATPIAPFVRVPQGLYHFIARTLDAGALGVMIGNVETAAQARAIVSAAKYAPLGKRGVGLGTAHNDYAMPDAAAYFEFANRNTTVICQIESVIGLSNLEEIAQIEGVDVLWVGHHDLSQSMGIHGQFQHPAFQDAMERVVAAANRHGKLAAVQPGNMQQAEAWLKTGFHVLSWKTDIALYRAALEKELNELSSLSGRLRARSDSAAR
jgi:2-dehydro-3-deoxyglucarate aldolase/4-hydroxy-2-oxoheptanedioate aldolase